MTIRDLAEVQSDSVDIKVFETVDGLAVEKASFKILDGFNVAHIIT